MRPNQQHHIISAKDLAIGYKNSLVAEGINFDAFSGELIGIVGVNGIGKSTLLRTLGNMQPSLSGNIFIQNDLLRELNPKKLSSEISVVLTEPIASKNLTVEELIALGRQPYTNWIGTITETDASKILESIQLLKLDDLLHKKCYELSDGQLQRVLIARALVQDTSLILLDEPTTHLDLYHKVNILKLLRTIAHQTGKTILFTTHEIELAIQLCDKMLLLNAMENPFGTPTELTEQKAFEQLFPADTIFFDPTTGSFRIDK